MITSLLRQFFYILEKADEINKNLMEECGDDEKLTEVWLSHSALCDLL